MDIGLVQIIVLHTYIGIRQMLLKIKETKPIAYFRVPRIMKFINNSELTAHPKEKKIKNPKRNKNL